MVTPELFRRYPDARALAAAAPADDRTADLSTGFFRQKSRSIVGMATELVARFGGEVPADMDALVTLPGVGRKTANVVLGHALGVPGLPVDRHVLRVAGRLGLVTSDDPEKVEADAVRVCSRQSDGPRGRTCSSCTGDAFAGPSRLCPRCNARKDCDFFQSGGVVKSGTRKRSKPRLRQLRHDARKATKR